MKQTQKISKKEILIRILIILLVFTLVYYSGDSQKQMFSTMGFLIAFLASIYLHKHFFPFLIFSIFCYLTASLQELWNENYIYLPITKFLWTAGNIFLPIGILNFIYNLIYNYKIIENENEF